MSRKPDFDQFLKVLNLEQPDYVPLYEHYADKEIMEAILARKCPVLKNDKSSKTRYMQFYVDFYQKLGFDCLPFEFGLSLFHLTGRQSKGRVWMDHDRSTIANMEEFDDYPGAKIEVKGSKVAHYLNGVKVLEYERGTQMWKALVAYSKYTKWPAFGEAERGHILLQDHGDDVSFKNIRILELE